VIINHNKFNICPDLHRQSLIFFYREANFFYSTDTQRVDGPQPNMGIFHTSKWVAVNFESGKLRVVEDFRRINQHITMPTNNIPVIGELLQGICDSGA